MTSTLNRIQGALLGVHAGDSLGATLEFTTPETARERYPNGLREIVGGGPFGWSPGDATDDTDLTVAIADAYCSSGDQELEVLTRDAAERMLAWYKRGPRDVGGATANGLGTYQRTGKLRSGSTAFYSQGNGSLMRTVAVGCARSDSQRRHAEAEAMSAVTHAHTNCVLACVIYCDIVDALVGGASPEVAVNESFEVLNLKAGSKAKAVLDAVERGRHLASDPTAMWPQARGWVLDSLTLSIWALLDGRPFEDVIVDIVMHGGDSDTNGACAGGLVGARDGLEGIPARWVDKLQFRQHLLDTAETLNELRKRGSEKG